MLIHCILKETYETIKDKECFDYNGDFIHCSFVTNFKTVAPLFEEDKQSYCLLLLKESAITSKVKVEDGYPHIYGSLNTSAIIKVVDFDYYKIFEKYKEIEFSKKYLTSTAKLILKTWPYYKDLFIGLKDDLILYKGIVEATVLDCDYAKLIVDENDEVVAMFFASTNFKKNITTNIKFILLAIRYLFKVFITKRFGKSIHAWRVIRKYISLLESVVNKHKDKDVEVQLFITDSSIQGLGFGKKLMTDFLNMAKKNKAHSAFLLTDKGCNYGFYDYYGFTKIEEFHSDLLDKKEESVNGFIYTITF